MPSALNWELARTIPSLRLGSMSRMSVYLIVFFLTTVLPLLRQLVVFFFLRIFSHDFHSLVTFSYHLHAVV